MPMETIYLEAGLKYLEEDSMMREPEGEEFEQEQEQEPMLGHEIEATGSAMDIASETAVSNDNETASTTTAPVSRTRPPPRISLQRVARIRLGPGALAEPDSDEDDEEEEEDDDDDYEDRYEDVTPPGFGEMGMSNFAVGGGRGDSADMDVDSMDSDSDDDTGRKGAKGPKGVASPKSGAGGASSSATQAHRPSLTGHGPSLLHGPSGHSPVHAHVVGQSLDVDSPGRRSPPGRPVATTTSSRRTAATATTTTGRAQPPAAGGVGVGTGTGTGTRRTSGRTQRPSRRNGGVDPSIPEARQEITIAAAFVKGNQRPYQAARMAAVIPPLVIPTPKTPDDVLKIFKPSWDESKPAFYPDSAVAVSSASRKSLGLEASSATVEMGGVKAAESVSRPDEGSTKSNGVVATTGSIPTPMEMDNTPQEQQQPTIPGSISDQGQQQQPDSKPTISVVEPGSASACLTPSSDMSKEERKENLAAEKQSNPVNNQDKLDGTANVKLANESRGAVVVVESGATTNQKPLDSEKQGGGKEGGVVVVVVGKSAKSNAPNKLALEITPVQPPGWTCAELEALDHGLEIVGKNFTRISREYVRTRTTAECIEAYYASKHALRSMRIKNYRKNVAREDDEYARYVAGLGKFVAAETRRMRTERTGNGVGGGGGGVGGTGGIGVADGFQLSSLNGVLAGLAAADGGGAGGVASTGRVRTRARAIAGDN
ncbi:hypothetical protein HDU76_009069 [Blyttiomyces sp. JEL0837]|nr:hypothetical protein HDU76_009069 [Blyttiomyces sp. JEL0837]